VARFYHRGGCTAAGRGGRCARRIGGELPPTYRTLSSRVIGSLAIVDAAVREHLPDLEAAWRETDLFVPDGNRWRYVYNHETPIPQPPPAAALGEDHLDGYIGRYRNPTHLHVGARDAVRSVQSRRKADRISTRHRALSRLRAIRRWWPSFGTAAGS